MEDTIISTFNIAQYYAIHAHTCKLSSCKKKKSGQWEGEYPHIVFEPLSEWNFTCHHFTLQCLVMFY